MSDLDEKKFIYKSLKVGFVHEKLEKNDSFTKNGVNKRAAFPRSDACF